MELFFGIVSIGIAILLVVIICGNKKASEDVVPSAVLGAFIMSFLIIGIGIIYGFANPIITPMDVYRGKTTLEITYKEGIAIDSVVVWKEEVK
jgi:hypothetical protein